MSAREAPASGATVVIVLGATAAVVVALWAAGRRDAPRPGEARSAWLTAAPAAPPAAPEAVVPPREPVTEPVVRQPTEVLGEGGAAAFDPERGRVSVRDAHGRVVYEAPLSELVRAIRATTPPDAAREVAASVDLADGRRIVLSPEVWQRLPLDRRYTHETGPPAQPAPKDARPVAPPPRRGP